MKTSKELTLIERTSSYWFLAVVILLGLVVLYIGFNPTFGGVLIGGGVSTILSKLVGESLEKQVKDIDPKLDNILQSHETNISQLYLNITDVLSKTVNFPWTTDEKKLKNHRVCMHEYYLTRNSHEEFWIYRQLDFSKHLVPGRLYTRQIIFMYGKEYEYEFDGFLIDIRLVITVKPVGRLKGF